MIGYLPASIHPSEENNPFFTCRPRLCFREIQNIRKRCVFCRAACDDENFARKESADAVSDKDNVTAAMDAPFVTNLF